MKLLLGVVIGLVIAGVIAWVWCDMRLAVREVRYMGEIESPLIRCLENIVQTYDDGKAQLAEAKVRLLTASWQSYWETREPNPEIFQEILVLELDQSPTGK